MKLTINHTTETRAGTSLSITGKQIIRIGRRPDNDCVFDQDDDIAVSGYHAEIRIVNERAHLFDKGSTNGTIVNGKRVDHAELQPSDEICLGDNGPRFRIEYAAPTIQPMPGSAAAAGAPKSAPAGPAVTEQVASPMGQPAQQPPTPAAPEGGDKVYGQRTVGVMIQQALDAAGQEKGKGTSKSTEYFEAPVDKKVKRTSSKMKWIIIAGIGTLIIVGTIFAIYMYNNRSVQVFQTTQVTYGGAEGSRIASANRYNVFMIAGRSKSRPSSSLQGFCTGFAIRTNVLATNAHCVRASKKFTNVTALMNGAPSPTGQYPVIQMVAHPGYRDGGISPDVGLMKIQGNLTGVVTLADATELSQVAPGIDMFLYGFPGRLNKEDAPEATFIDGKIGRVTSFDQQLGDYNSNTLLQHSAYCTGGTSGSPMFNSSGKVIGINAGGYVENGKALAGYNFGMRIDLAYALLSSLGVR